jgi:transposase
MNYFVGIDNSSSTHSIYIINEDELVVKQFTIQNNLNGFREMESVLVSLDNVSIAFELPYGPLVDFLREKKYVFIYSINPLKIKRFKETVVVSGNKDDTIDARAIALYLKRNYCGLQRMHFNSKAIEELNLYRISHDRLTKEHARFKNKLRFLVRQYFPLYDTLFGSFGCKVMLYMLLQYPRWNKLKAVDEQEITRMLVDNKYRVMRNIANVLEKIKNYDQIVSPEVDIALSIEATAIARVLLTIKMELEKLERNMSTITNNHRLGSVFSICSRIWIGSVC